MNNVYVTSETPKMPRYVMVYKGLMEYAGRLGLDLTAVMLYAILLCRATFSNRNGWRDDQGRIYVVMPRGEAAKILGCAKGTVVKAFGGLVDAGLIEEQARRNRNNCTVAPHIYLRQWGCPSSRLSVAEIMAGALPYITAANVGVIADNYVEIPVTLLKREDITLRAKVLYALVWDMTRLSIDYGRCDSGGRYWCEIDANQAKVMLGCGHTALSNAYTELVGLGLITRIRVEYGCGMRTYLHPCWVQGGDKIDIVKDDTSNHQYEPPQSSAPEGDKEPHIAPQCSENCAQDISTQIALSMYPQEGNICASARDVAEQRYREQLCVDEIKQLLACGTAHDVLMQVLSVMVDDTVTKAKRVKVGGNYINRDDLVESYSYIDRDTMLLLVAKIEELWPQIRSPAAYVRTALYTARNDYYDAVCYMRSQHECHN